MLLIEMCRNHQLTPMVPMSGAQNSCADSIPSNDSIKVRAIVALVLFPVRGPACRGPGAAFRASYAIVLFLLVYLGVTLAVSRFRHD